MSVAEARDIVFVAAEVLLLGGSGFWLVGLIVGNRGRKDLLELERAELLIYDLPDDLVGRHDGERVSDGL